MEMTKPKLQYTVCEEKGGMPVIIVAAGSSRRMEGTDKQLLLLGGMPVLARTLFAFENSPDISRIILVTKKESVLKMQSLCNEFLFNKVTDIVCGGDTRSESVLCGMKRLGEDEKKVLIHDGARPFVNKKIISQCVNALMCFDGCVPCVKVTDTVKSSGDGEISEKTVSRDKLYLAQTPQGVDVALYLKAIGDLKGESFTDDASVLEAAGKRVKITEGDKYNIKITTREDIAFANAILKIIGEGEMQ